MKAICNVINVLTAMLMQCRPGSDMLRVKKKKKNSYALFCKLKSVWRMETIKTKKQSKHSIFTKDIFSKTDGLVKRYFKVIK